MNFDIRHSQWAAWINVVAAIITVAGVMSNFTSFSILGPLQNIVQLPAWLLLVGFIFIPSLTVIIQKAFSAKPDYRNAALFKYGSHPDVLKIIDSNGKEYIGGYADNFYWKEIAAAICKDMELSNLRYSNVGSQYHLEDIATGRVINIPTDNYLEEKVTKTGARNGQILLIVENRS
jgi:hypothetical protein